MKSADNHNYSHSRQETREGQLRPINKDYYFIDFHAAIDAIKYRTFRLTQKVNELYKPTEEKKDYKCPQCHAQWTQLEVLDKVGPMGFECHRCSGLLEREEPSAGDSTGHEKQSKLMGQFEELLKMLQQIDSQDIPSNDFETAFSLAVPVQRNEMVNPIRPTVPINPSTGPPTAVKGITQVTVAPLDVSVTTGSERTAAEQAAEAQQKANLAAQNVLPVWHTTSTVTGDTFVSGRKDSEVQGSQDSHLKDEDEEKKGNVVLNDELTAYYNQMLKEKEKEAKEDREADASSGDDEDDEFEDVGVGVSTLGTPSSSMSATPHEPQNRQPNAAIKPKGSESRSNTPDTNTSTSAGFRLVVDDDGPAAKKVKFESQENGAGKQKLDMSVQPDKDSDEDEEAEFEDAL